MNRPRCTSRRPLRSVTFPRTPAKGWRDMEVSLEDDTGADSSDEGLTNGGLTEHYSSSLRNLPPPQRHSEPHLTGSDADRKSTRLNSSHW